MQLKTDAERGRESAYKEGFQAACGSSVANPYKAKGDSLTLYRAWQKGHRSGLLAVGGGS